jgi:hypothetical protein
VDKFRWYDWFFIFMIADMTSATIMVILMGAIEMVFVLPVFVIAWLSYEDFRGRQENGKDSE